VFLIAKMDSVLHDQRLRQWVRQTLSDSKKSFDPGAASSSKITILVDLSAPQQPFIFVMRANPEPVHRVALQQPECAVTTANTHRPESASLFEVERTMVRTALPQAVGLPGMAALRSCV
jgi:hypothetical protein